MEATELEGHRRALLVDLEAMLRESFALESWGRLVVELVRDAQGELRVSDLVVEEILGDEGVVDRCFSSGELRACLPALARAAETLCLLEELDVDLLGGATILRKHDRLGRSEIGGAEPSIAFLPGRVRMPSRGLDARREMLLAALGRKNDALRERWGIGADARVEADMLTGEASIRRGAAVVAEGRQIVLGSFSLAPRSWVWGAHNPTLEPEARQRAAALLDRVADRSGWEVSTPGFQTDEPTTWLLAALLADAGALEGVVRVGAGTEGFVMLGLSALQKR
jgi:hypothetical protein